MRSLTACREPHRDRGGEQERPDRAPSAAEPEGARDRRLEVAFEQVFRPLEGLGFVADQRMRERRHNRHRERDRCERDRRAGEAPVGVGEAEREERQHRREQSRSREAAPEGEVVAGVVEEVARADRADRDRLRAPSAAVQQHDADRRHREHGESASRPRELSSSVASTRRLGMWMPKRPCSWRGMLS